jgi:integrase
MPTRRRRFGHVRQLPSKRWQASYIDPDGRRHSAAETFERKRDAEQWPSLVEAQMSRGEWINPDDQAVTLDGFGNRWIEERPGLRPRTVDLYRWLFGKHVSPHLGRVMLGDLDAARVRRWRAKLLGSGVSPTMTAKAYRLLRAILMTAVDDGVLARNPCRIKGAGSEPTPERPVLDVGQVLALAESLSSPFGLLVLVTTFGSLRWGEVTALRRVDVDLVSGTLHVWGAFVERSTGELIRGLPKSRAGLRVVTLPRPVAEVLSTPRRACGRRPPVARVYRRQGRPAAAEQLQPDGAMAGAGRGCGRAGAALPRSSAYRQPACRREQRVPAGSHEPDGSRQHAGRSDLSAHDAEGGSQGRGRVGAAARRARRRQE